MTKYSIAIDGPAASGKSSTAEDLAKELDFQRIDSGSLYRAVTYLVLKEFGAQNLDIQNEKVKKFIKNLNISQRQAKTFSNEIDISEYLHKPEIDSNVGKVAKESYVREKMKKIQQEAIKYATNGIVIDGRDIGTVIIPDAFLKVFITAKDTTRALRRSNQTGQSYEEVLADLRKRDHEDITRQHGPLKKADDAVVIENDNITKREAVEMIVKIFNEKINKN
jgi:cytidylate kinase